MGGRLHLLHRDVARRSRRRTRPARRSPRRPEPSCSATGAGGLAGPEERADGEMVDLFVVPGASNASRRACSCPGSVRPGIGDPGVGFDAERLAVADQQEQHGRTLTARVHQDISRTDRMVGLECRVVELAPGRQHELGCPRRPAPAAGCPGPRWRRRSRRHHLGAACARRGRSPWVGARPLVPELRIGGGPAVRLRRLHTRGRCSRARRSPPGSRSGRARSGASPRAPRART